MFRVAVVNPTSIRDKAHEFCMLPFDVCAVSETSATAATQKHQTHKFKAQGLRVIWGHPTPSQRVLADGRDAVRGVSSWVCCISRTSVRESRGNLPLHWRATCRILITFVHLKHFCLRFIILYGVPGGSQDQMSRNNSLWKAVHSIICEHDMPTIVAGDFNCPPQKCEPWDDLRNMGFHELFQFHRNLYGEELPATCKGATQNDSIVFSHHLASAYRSAQVYCDAPFKTHSPLIATFDLQCHDFCRRTFCMPDPLYDAILTSELFQHQQAKHALYCTVKVETHLREVSHENLTKAFKCVGQTFENAYEHTQRFMCDFTPEDSPPPLLRKQKGRLQPREIRKLPCRKTPKKAREGCFEPPCEIFKLRTIHWVRQLRRLESIRTSIKKYCDSDIPNHVSQQLRNEWQAICRASGFPKGFQNWCILNNVVDLWYCDIPPFDWIDILVSSFREGVDHVCRAEDKASDRVEKFTIAIDQMHFGSAMAFRKLKPSSVLCNDHLWVSNQCKATRVRSRGKNKPCVKIDSSEKIEPLLPVQISGQDIAIEDMDRDILYLDNIPEGTGSQFPLYQSQPIFDPEQLHRHFFDFWAPFWMRDQGPQLVDISAWPRFLEMAQGCGFFSKSEIEYEITLEDWRQAIKDTKRKTARGSCGFSQPELVALHSDLLACIVRIFRAAVHVGLPSWLMIARLALVPKGESSCEIKSLRPITIFSLLFRVWAKTISKKLLLKWSYTLPETITAGLPKRSCTHLSLRSAIAIEENLQVKNCIGVYILDITKCFNGFPRIPVMWLLRAEGFTQSDHDLWLNSMACMSRVVQLGMSCSTPHIATTGMAEGDPLAVCGMAQIANMWFRLFAKCNVAPSSFADNWSWFGNCVEDHIAALSYTHEFLKVLGLESDPQKCWAWGSSKYARNMWHEISQRVFGSPKTIQVVLEEKDLGVQMHYAAVTHLGCALDRLEAGIAKIHRLWHAPYQIDRKCFLIQSGIYPSMFYGTFAVYLGKKRFAKIRTTIGNAVLHRTVNTNPMLVGSLLSQTLDDPFIYVLKNALFQWYSFLHTYPHLRGWAYKSLNDASTNPNKAIGPAGCLKCYCNQIGWQIHEGGVISDHCGLLWNLHTMTWPSITDRLYSAWDVVVTTAVRERDGLQDLPVIDLAASHIHDMNADARHTKIIAMHQTLSVIYQSQKTKWKNSQVHCAGAQEPNTFVPEPGVEYDNCPLCTCQDTKVHFLFECEKLQDIRDQYHEAFETLQRKAPWTFCVPVVFRHSLHDAYTVLNYNRNYLDPFLISDQATVPVFFVDGSCSNPEVQHGRCASFAIIHDRSHSPDVRLDLVHKYRMTGCSPESLVCCQSGLIVGQQTITRAEFFCIVQIVRSVERAKIFSDSSAAIEIFHSLQQDGDWFKYYKHSCFDLILMLMKAFEERDPYGFEVVKVKAHREDCEAENNDELYKILGNRMADSSCKAILAVSGVQVIDAAAMVARHVQTSRDQLKQFLPALVEMDIRRMDERTKWTVQRPALIEQSDTQDVAASQHFREQVNFSPPVGAFLSFQPGARFLKRFLDWASMIRWPINGGEAHTSAQTISYQELVINLLICTQQPLPRVLDERRKGVKLHYIDPSEQNLAVMMPIGMPEAVKLVQHTAKFLHTFWGIEVFPMDHKTTGRLVCWLGNRMIVSGFSCRPWLPFFSVHSNFLPKAITSDGIHLPEVPKVSTSISNDWPEGVPVISAEDITCNLRKLYKGKMAF